MATSPHPPARVAADRSSRQAQFRRRRLGVAAGIAVVVALVAWLATGSGSPSRKGSSVAGSPDASVRSAAIPAVEAGVLPWKLHAPISREVAVAGGSGTLLIAGGLGNGGANSSQIISLDVRSGNETALGTLATGVRDAAGAVIGPSVAIAGGGDTAATSAVQMFPAPPGAGNADPPPPGWTPGSGLPGIAPVVITGQTTFTKASTQASATASTEMPRARAGAHAATVGRVTYILGGYDGSSPDPDVLATTDGTHYRVVGKLVRPVRDPGVAVVDSTIYIFGGQALSGASAGAAVDTVQAFDPGTGQVRIAGTLPTAVAGASAFSIQGHLYIAGGVTNGPPAANGSAAPLSTAAVDTIWAWDQHAHRALSAGRLQIPVAYAGTAVTYGRAWLIGGETAGVPIDSAQMAVPNSGFGTAGTPEGSSPYFGYKLLIADRGNDRLLVLNPGDQVTWTYPSVFAAAPPGGFYFPDDAFFAKGGSEIVSNQERNHTLVIIAFPSGQLLWQYGHPLREGSAPGYLSWPDDAYLLKDGEVTVADDRNCRILFISPQKTVTAQIGATGKCTHQPPSGVAEPNGDTPLADGNYLVSEIQGQWISEYSKSGQLVWTTHIDIHYPSDPQQLGPDLYLVSDYAITPGGAIDEFNREGQVLYRLQPSSGIARMNQPSLTELLPSGVFMTNDDYRDRMIAFDPPTGAVVWQYGVADHPGTAPGYLNTPDGFDLLAPDGSTPTHPATG